MLKEDLRSFDELKSKADVAFRSGSYADAYEVRETPFLLLLLLLDEGRSSRTNLLAALHESGNEVTEGRERAIE